MANKKKKNAAKQRNQRQQKKQQRRDQRQRRRQSQQNASLAASRLLRNLQSAIDPEVLADFGSGTIDDILDTAWDTVALYEEPEFDELFIEPVEVAGTFIQTAESMGVSPEEGFGSDRIDDVLDATVKAVLTPELRWAIIDLLEELRDRAREEADQALLKKAAAVQYVLQAEIPAFYESVGFLRALVTQNIGAGFVLLDIAFSAEEADAGDEAPASKLTSEAIMEKLEGNLALERYMAQNIHRVEMEGLHAAIEGELQLNLFTEAEKEEIVNRLEAELAKFDEEDEEEDGETEDREIEDLTAGDEEDEDDGPRSWLEIVREFVDEITTPERTAEFRATFKAYADDPAHKDQPGWEYVSLMANAELEDTDLDTDSDSTISPVFLSISLWREIKPLMEARDLLEEDDDDDDDEQADENAEEQSAEPSDATIDTDAEDRSAEQRDKE